MKCHPYALASSSSGSGALSHAISSTFTDSISCDAKFPDISGPCALRRPSQQLLGDVVYEWLRQQESDAGGLDFKYKTLDEETKDTIFSRVGTFEVNWEASGKKWRISIPLYVLYGGTRSTWHFYVLPSTFYESLSKSRASNADLEADDMESYDPYVHGGAHIYLNSPTGTAKIVTVHWKSGVQPEFEPKLNNRDLSEEIFSQVQWDGALSAAFDNLLPKFGVQTLQTSDRALISCNDPGVDTRKKPAVSLLFHRIFRGKKISYFMEKEFGFDIAADNNVLLFPPGAETQFASKRAIFEFVAKLLHDTTLDEVFRQIGGAWAYKKKSEYAVKLHELNILTGKRYTAEQMKEDRESPEYQELNEAVRKLFGEVLELRDLYLGLDPAFIREYGDLGRNIYKEYQKTAHCENKHLTDVQLWSLPMGKLMRVLWNKGERPLCGRYIELIDLIYGAYDHDTGNILRKFDSEYSDHMHRLREAAQTLVKTLPLETREAGAASAKLIPYLQSNGAYKNQMEYTPSDLNPIDSPSTVLIINALLGLCLFVVCCCFCLLLLLNGIVWNCDLHCHQSKRYAAVKNCKDTYDYESVSNNALSQT
eukprot:114942_1